MTQFADNPMTENAKKRLEEDKAVVEQSRQEYADRAKGKPTPTQEENDLAALGAHITEHDDDGGGPDPFDTRNRAIEGQQAGGYQTRNMQSGHSRSAPTPHSTSSPAGRAPSRSSGE